MGWGKGYLGLIFQNLDHFIFQKDPEQLIKLCDDVSNLKGFNREKCTSDIVNAYNKVSGLNIPYKIVGRRPGDVDKCYADPSKAEKYLGWKAQYSIEEMCIDSYNWQTKNPNGYNE